MAPTLHLTRRYLSTLVIRLHFVWLLSMLYQNVSILSQWFTDNKGYCLELKVTDNCISQTKHVVPRFHTMCIYWVAGGWLVVAGDCMGVLTGWCDCVLWLSGLLLFLSIMTIDWYDYVITLCCDCSLSVCVMTVLWLYYDCVMTVLWLY